MPLAVRTAASLRLLRTVESVTVASNQLRFDLLFNDLPSFGGGVARRSCRVAPKSAYWRSLLHRQTEAFSISLINQAGWSMVTVQLPPQHDCINSASPRLAVPPVLYEDDAVVVFDKPAGQPTMRHGLCNTLTERYRPNNAMQSDLVASILRSKEYGPTLRDPALFRAGQVQRLDADTTGVWVMAKTSDAVLSLRHQMGTGDAIPFLYQAVLCAVCGAGP